MLSGGSEDEQQDWRWVLTEQLIVHANGAILLGKS